MKQPKEDSFENAWKEAFDKANLAPPDIIWENIEKSLPQNNNYEIKPDTKNVTTSTKLLIGTGIILISGLSYFYLSNSSSNNYNNNLNNSKNEKDFNAIVKPTTLDTKIEKQNLVSSPSITTKQQVNLLRKVKKPSVEVENENQDSENLNSEIIESIPMIKIEEKLIEMIPKSIKMSKIILDTPDLVPNTDSQIVAPYYDPNAIPAQQKNKGEFWRNFKIRGGIRVSN